MAVRFIDTHAHIDFEAFDDDREQVIAAGLESGITHILNPGVDTDSCRKALTMASQYAGVFCGVGVHPNSAQTWQADTLGVLNHLADAQKVLAIGEIGLDYYRNAAPRNLQMQVFRAQLYLAAEKKLPVIIHNREAFDDAYAVVKEWHADLSKDRSPLAERPGVFHAFSGGLEEAEKVIELNFFIGVTGVVTYPKAEKVRHVCKSVPLERLLLETDAPFLSPQERRGDRNEPAHLRWTAKKVAEVREISLDDVGENTSMNAMRLFDWRDIP